MSFMDVECPKCGHVFIDEIVNFVLPMCPLCHVRMVMRKSAKK